jgi:hypothetical protein
VHLAAWPTLRRNPLRAPRAPANRTGRRQTTTAKQRTPRSAGGSHASAAATRVSSASIPPGQPRQSGCCVGTNLVVVARPQSDNASLPDSPTLEMTVLSALPTPEVGNPGENDGGYLVVGSLACQRLGTVGLADAPTRRHRRHRPARSSSGSEPRGCRPAPKHGPGEHLRNQRLIGW